MPIEFYEPTVEINGRFCDPNVPAMHRHFFITDKDGVVVEIRSQTQLNEILAQMTPEQLEQWKANYRFTPITTPAGGIGHTGLSRDVGHA
jgi:hypothetical protein